MEELEKFVKANVCDCSANLPSRELLHEAEGKIGVKLGKELSEYLLKYGYLGLKHVEFYGMNSKQNLDSDMVKQTLHLHEHFGSTKSYIALEHPYEHVHYLVDTDDKVYRYNDLQDELEQTDDTVFSYILKTLKDIE